MPFEQELEVYNKNLAVLLLSGNEGKFTVIHGQDITGPFDTYEAALEAGYERFGPVPFLVKKIQQVEEELCFSRDLPCPS